MSGHALMTQSASRYKGFTLLELMVVIAIIGILASISAPIFRDYIANANMVKVSQHYLYAARFAESELRRLQAQAVLSSNQSLADLLPSEEEFIDQLNGQGAKAPGGGPAYAPESGDGGVIGIEVTGEGTGLIIRVHRPAYHELEAASRVISYEDL